MRNDPALWVRAENVFEAIIDREMFEAASKIIQTRSIRLSDAEMLDSLRGILGRIGALSGLIIDEAEGCPSSSSYQNRFGSLLRAYQLVGYTPERDYRYVTINRALRLLHPNIVEEVISGIGRAGGSAKLNQNADLLTVNDEFSVSVVVARCFETQAGSLRWYVRLDRGLSPDLTVAVRMDRSNIAARDYLILPSFDMDSRVLKLAEHNGLSLDAYLYESLEPIFELAERIHISEVA